jgi:hypothetical protein
MKAQFYAEPASRCFDLHFLIRVRDGWVIH